MTLDFAALKNRVPGSLSVREMRALAEVATSSGAQHALEVGHYYGLSTCVLLESLPEGCTLMSIDHHQGDQWASAAPVEEFYENILPHTFGKSYRIEIRDFRTGLEKPQPHKFDFVFYDADHGAQANWDFWHAVAPHLSRMTAGS